MQQKDAMTNWHGFAESERLYMLPCPQLDDINLGNNSNSNSKDDDTTMDHKKLPGMMLDVCKPWRN
eukprot:scaffold59037_cov24-Prasinocladus_malaysianus.AAC.1